MIVTHVYDLPMEREAALPKIQSVLNVGREVIFEVVRPAKRKFPS